MIKFMLNSIIVVLFITIVLPVFVAVGLAVLILVAR